MPPKDNATAKARNELARVNEHISQLKTEIRVLEARRGEIRDDIDRENNALKLKAGQELAETMKRAEEAVKPLVAQRSAIQRQISELERQAQTEQMEVVGAQNELIAVRAQLAQLHREIDEARATRESHEAHAVSVSAKITNLQSQVQPLKEELSHLKDEVEGYTGRREDALWELTQTQAELNAQKTSLTRDVAKLQEKRREVASNLALEAKQTENTRTALADWEARLQKFDKTLRAREYKVAVDEEKIAQNAGLLNL